MKNSTYVDQCDTIRTLTEEEMAVVSGGNWQDINNRILKQAALFESRPTSYYVPRGYHSASFWHRQFFAVAGMF